MWFEVPTLDAVPVDALSGCDVFLHLAAHGVVSGMDDWETCFQVNLTQSLRLWQRAASAGINRFLICGSCFEYGRAAERYSFIPVDAPLEPIGAYASSKAAATVAALGLAAERKLSLTVLRPFHVYGEGEAATRFWPSLKKAALSGADFEMTLGEQVRDFVPVERVAEAFLNLASSEYVTETPQIKNIGSGEACSLIDFARFWWSQWGAHGELRPGLRPYRQNEIMRYVPLT
jgi:nucleoside-diphosphate-sugar epimerase